MCAVRTKKMASESQLQFEQRVRDGIAHALLQRFEGDRATYARLLAAMAGRKKGVSQEGLVAAASALGQGGAPMLSAIVRASPRPRARARGGSVAALACAG